MGTEDIIKAKERYGGESNVAVKEVEVWDHFRIQKRGGSPWSRCGMESRN